MGTGRSMRTIAGIAVGIVASAVLTAQPAHAMPTNQEEAGFSNAAAVVVTTHGDLAMESSTQAECAPKPVEFYAHVGYKICDTTHVVHEFADGHARAFVIGTDHAIWNIVKYPNGTVSGWRSLGGWLQGGVEVDFVNTPYDLQIFSLGRYREFFCNRLYNNWSGWFAC
jgi:hypothetical protein